VARGKPRKCESLCQEVGSGSPLPNEASDVEEVIFNPVDRDVSRSSGLPIRFGFTPDERYILVVYEQIDETTIYPVTAYEVEE
jgi:hypothetical protein